MPVRLEHQGLCVRGHMWEELGPRAVSFRLQPGPDKRLCVHSGVLLAHTALCGALGCATDPSRLGKFYTVEGHVCGLHRPHAAGNRLHRTTMSDITSCTPTSMCTPCPSAVRSSFSLSFICVYLVPDNLAEVHHSLQGCAIIMFFVHDMFLQKCLTVHRAHHKHVHVVLS